MVERAVTAGKVRDATAVFIAATLMLAAGCAGTNVTMVGPMRPARPEDCQVAMFPGKAPDFPFVDIATVQAWCKGNLTRTECIDVLRKRACTLGADVMYSFNDSADDQESYVSATVAYRVTSRAPQGPAAAAPAAGECTPICSPGFACQAGTCIPQCNPACEAGEICNRHRTCEPGAPAPHQPS